MENKIPAGLIRASELSIKKDLPRDEAVTVDPRENQQPGGVSIPPRQDMPKEPERVSLAGSYDGTGLIKRIDIVDWQTRFSFYTGFRRTAEHLWNKTCDPCDFVPFFSYMPLYEQLDKSQLHYYLYWRHCARRGTYLRTSCSYVFLFVYEIINIGPCPQNPHGAETIALLWKAYRDEFKYLDKYICTWLADYCLIYRVPLPVDIIAPFISDVVASAPLPELYMSADSGDDLYSILCMAASLDHTKSKYYPQHSDLYDTHMPAAVRYALSVGLGDGRADEYLYEAHSMWDSFSGAAVTSDAKYHISVTYLSYRRSPELKAIVVLTAKACENRLRAYIGLKSRFNVDKLPYHIKKAVDAYFDEHLPTEDHKTAQEIPEYLSYYEPTQTGEADIERALNIENDAWLTAVLLDGDNLTVDGGSEREQLSEITNNTFVLNENFSQDNEFSDFVRSLDDTEISLLSAACDGTFVDRCRALGLMPSQAQQTVNDKALDTVGDCVIDGGALIEDYKDDILSALNERGENGRQV